jgi:nucleotide-binding universal stress UspA family protein
MDKCAAIPFTLWDMFELGTDGPSVLMVGVDGSLTSLRAGAYAVGLARRQHSKLVVVHVSVPSRFANMAPQSMALARQAAAEITEDLRQQVAEQAAARGVSATFIAVAGDPFTELVRVADQVRADGIVVGASTQLAHRIAGSMAVRLIRTGRWPVTVVP